MFTRSKPPMEVRSASDPLAGFSLSRLLLAAADPLGRVQSAPEFRHCEPLMRNRTDRALGDGAVSVPLDVFRRDLTVGTNSAGGYTVGSPVVAHGGSLIGADITDLVTVVPLERGAPSVPVIDTAPVHTWLDGEGGAISDDGGSFASVALTHTGLGMMFRFSAQLARGGGRAFEALMRGEIERGMRRAVGSAILAGSGSSGEPQGLTGTAGVITASGTALSYASILDLIRQAVATGAKLSDLTFIVGSQTFEVLAGRERASGSGYILDNLMVCGIPVVVSELAATDSLFIGPWRECVLATWGGLDLLVDRRSAVYGNIRISAFLDLAIAFRRPGSFVVVTSVT